MKLKLSKPVEGQQPGAVIDVNEVRGTWLQRNGFGAHVPDDYEEPEPQETSEDDKDEASTGKTAAEWKADYEDACKTIAAMHEAAVGEAGTGPRRGVVEDVQDVSDAAYQLAGAVIWMSGSRDFGPEGEAHEEFVNIRDNVLKPYLETSRGKALSDKTYGSAAPSKSDTEPEQPNISDLKPVWIEYAIAKGEDPAAAEAMTKDALIEKYAKAS